MQSLQVRPGDGRDKRFHGWGQLDETHRKLKLDGQSDANSYVLKRNAYRDIAFHARARTTVTCLLHWTTSPEDNEPAKRAPPALTSAPMFHQPCPWEV
jgi:hypothetical protein